LKHANGRIHCAGSEMATSPKISRSRVDSLPQKAPVTTKSNGSTKPSRMSSPMKFAECCTAKPLPPPSYLFCLVPSGQLSHTVYMIALVAFIHSCIHAFTPRYFCEFTHLCVHKAHAYTTSIHTWLHQLPRVYSGSIPFGSVLDHFKWRVPTNKQLEPFQKCHPQCVWSRGVTNQSFQVASFNKRTTCNPYAHQECHPQ